MLPWDQPWKVSGDRQTIISLRLPTIAKLAGSGHIPLSNRSSNEQITVLLGCFRQPFKRYPHFQVFLNLTETANSAPVLLQNTKMRSILDLNV